MMPIYSRYVLLIFLGVTAAGLSAPDPGIVRREFMDAMQRVRLHQPEFSDSAVLGNYVIHDYLTAARLKRDLQQKPDEPLDASIDAFLQSHAAQPVARTLRHDWLLSLAERHRWEIFLPRSVDSTDPQIVCQRMAGKLATGDTQDLAGAALARWSLPQRQPAECDEVLAWLRNQGVITPALAEARARAALAADNARLARESAADVPLARAAALLQWSDLLENPRSALTVLATHPALSVEPDALGAGFEKLTHSDSAAAMALLPALLARPEVTPALHTRLQRAAALGAAYDRDPRAIELFNRLEVEPGDALALEWRIRSTLWTGDFTKARSWIEALPASLASQPRWRYWHARAVDATAGAEAAAPFYVQVAGLRDFYGYLAADRLHQPYQLNARPSPDDVALQNAMAAETGLVRARELFACEMADEAQAEWATVLGGASPSLKIQAAHLAGRWGWYSQSIASLAQAGEWDDVRLRYPRPYADAVAAATKIAGVPSDWIWSVMRQESLFRRDAISRADARGLMQMLPATAVAVARRWHFAIPVRESLSDPEVSVPLGAAYLRELLDRHGGQLAPALAAYNAGPGPVVRWLPLRSMEADVWIENIPYGETRAYVQHILEHIVAFAWVRGGEQPALASMLRRIEPRYVNESKN